ncbi:MAG TPA: TetR family transcriptional regulator, partial [Moraxellaceae bacterium]|nr:TetR family transcriptional regulator [Moraxellaceae bacterium]
MSKQHFPPAPSEVPVVALARRGRPVDPAQSADRRLRLCEAAIGVALREGVTGLTLRAVGEAADMSPAMVAYEFENKDGLLLAMLETIHAGVRAALAGVRPERPGIGPALRHLAEAYWRHARETPGLQRVQYELTLHALGLAGGEALSRHQYHGYVTVVAEALGKAALMPVPQGWLRDLAGTCVALMDGIILQWLATGD